MGRPPCCDKSNVKRGLWTPEEDAKILAYVSNHGIGNWTSVPKKAGILVLILSNSMPTYIYMMMMIISLLNLWTCIFMCSSPLNAHVQD
jgi:hypothetical protein